MRIIPPAVKLSKSTQSRSTHRPARGARAREGRGLREHFVQPEGLRRENFEKIAENGFGDRYNGIAHSSSYFDDKLFIGTSRCNLQMIAVNNPPNTRVYPVKCPENVYDLDRRAQLWRYDPLSREWEQAYRSPVITGSDGTSIAQDIGYRAQVVFNGPSDSRPTLYICTWSSSKGIAPQLLRTEDGKSFERLGSLGSGDKSSNTFRVLVVFKDRLFTSPTGSTRGYGQASDMLAEATVYTTTDPVGRRWEIASAPRFADADNLTIFELAVFNDHLYAGTVNAKTGLQIWKTRAEGSPPFEWRKVLDQGAFRGNLNEVPASMTVFGDGLYVGSGIQNGGYDKTHNVGPAAAELIRIYPDDSWDLIIGKERDTPDGYKKPLADIGPGFDLFFNAHIWRGAVYNGWLYVGTYNWVAFLPYLSGERWPEHFRRRIRKWGIENLMAKKGGFDLWRTRDGVHWSPVTTTGFDNPYNVGVRQLVPTRHGLFLATANHFGPDVALRLPSDRWTYAPNPSSGTEVWLGTLPEGVPESREQTDEPELKKQALDLRVSYDTRMYEPLVEEYYDQSDFYSWGYWDATTATQKQACFAMMERFLASMPNKQGRILDVACGKGATTRHILEYYPPESIVGIDISDKLMGTCRKNAPGCDFRVMDATRLDFDDNSFENIICVDGAALFDTREKFLQEAFCVLQPGGYLVLSDRVLAKQVLHRVSAITRDNYVRDLTEYRNILEAVGFEEVRIEDNTHRCLQGYAMKFGEFVSQKFLGGEIDTEMFNNFMAFILSRLTIIQYYIFVSARKPAD